MLEEAKRLTTQLSTICGATYSSIDALQLWADFAHLNQEYGIATPAMLQKNGIDENKRLFQSLQACSAEIFALRSAIDADYEAEIYNLNGTELYQKLTKQFCGVFSRNFSKEYSEIIHTLRLCRQKGKRPKYQEGVRIVGILKDYQMKMQVFSTESESEEEIPGTHFHCVETDWDRILRQSGALSQMFANGLDCKQLATLSQEKLDIIQMELAEIGGKYDQHIASCLCASDCLNTCFDTKYCRQ